MAVCGGDHRGGTYGGDEFDLIDPTNQSIKHASIRFRSNVPGQHRSFNWLTHPDGRRRRAASSCGWKDRACGGCVMG